jgi:hypothetical protein
MTTSTYAQRIASLTAQGLDHHVAATQVSLEIKHAAKLAEQTENLRRIEAELRAGMK